MRRIFLLFASVAVLFSCQKKNEYIINGTVAGSDYEGKNVYVKVMAGNDMVDVDTVVVKDGAFTIKGTVDSTYLTFMVLDDSVESDMPNRLPVLVEPGVITVKFDSLGSVTGTPVNDAYSGFRGQYADLRKQVGAKVEEYNKAVADETLTDSLEAEIHDSYDKIVEEMNGMSYAFAKENIHNELGEYLFLISSQDFDLEQQKELLGLSSDKFKAAPSMQRLAKFIEKSESVGKGKKFIDFTLQDPSGKEVSLSDYAGKGKYVLVDFWAAWCGPCREEMPNVVEVYKKYKDKGFEVVGVSLDRDKGDWVKGIKDMNMTWPQMSDLKYFDSPVVELYAFRGIPHTVLLDKDGIIIETNLRGKKLNDKLAELL